MPALSRFIVIVALLLPGGCSIYSMPGSGERAPIESRDGGPVAPTPPPAPTPVTPEPSEPAEPASSAYQSLVARAEREAAQGDYDQALATLERAQRIDPDNADIYLQLAKTYAAKGDPVAARSAAERGLLYCRNTHQCDALRAYQ